MKTKKKKRFSPQFATIFGRKFVGSFSPGWLLLLWSSSAQLSMGGRLNLDGEMPKSRCGDANSRWGTRPPASALQIKYCPKLCQNICLVNICLYQTTLAPLVKPFNKLIFGGSVWGVSGGCGTPKLCQNFYLVNIH